MTNPDSNVVAPKIPNAPTTFKTDTSSSLGKSYTHAHIAPITQNLASLSERAMRSHSGNRNFTSTNHAFLSRLNLVKLKKKALRRGIWYRVLKKIERSLIDLVITTVNKVQSNTLAKSLTLILNKLSDIIETNIQHQIQTIGLPQAKKLSQIAQNWGNKSAVKWATDTKYARYLAICNLATPS
jgi:hypothetical protein